LFDEEVHVTINIRWNRDIGSIVIVDMIKAVNLSEDDKKFVSGIKAAAVCEEVSGEVYR
jgi:hypothetical protein